MTEICRAEDITFRYFQDSERNILEHMDLSFNEGEVTVLLGNSGCGKSTFAAVLCGLYPENGGFLESGKIIFRGEDLADMPFSQRCRRMAMMFQNPDLQFCMKNLREELLFCLENISVPREEMDERVSAFADRFHVGDLLERPFAMLSGGEKQKAALCCLLIIDPEVLVLDEPFANLDSVSRDAYLELLEQKVREDHTTIIAIDHRAANWFDLADRFVVLGEGGHVLKNGLSLEELREERPFLQEQGIADPFAQAVPKEKAVPAGERSAEERIIEIRDMSVFHKKVKEPVLAGVNLTACTGEMVACLGPSGGGKTSLFMTLLGQKKYKGSLKLLGKEISSWKKNELFARIGIVFQNPANQFVSTQVLAEVCAGLKVWKKLSQEEAEKEALEMLADYDLRPYYRYSPYMLSQGQQRRLGVLAMLAGGQRLLLLDEPTYGQDGRTTDAIMRQMEQKIAQGITMIFSTHDEQLAYRYADRIWRVKGGTAYDE